MATVRTGTGYDGDPLLGFTFQVQADNDNISSVLGYFTEFSGIGSENPAVDYKTVLDGREVLFKLPGRIEWGELTLKRGVTGNTAFWEWREQVLLGDIDNARCEMIVTMYDRAYNNALTWTISNAWPSKITGANLSADSNDFAVEEITIQHEGMKIDQPDGLFGQPLVLTGSATDTGNMAAGVGPGAGAGDAA
ncbi:MAG: phage tail protein [Chloroflexota bacterium]